MPLVQIPPQGGGAKIKTLISIYTTAGGGNVITIPAVDTTVSEYRLVSSKNGTHSSQLSAATTVEFVVSNTDVTVAQVVEWTKPSSGHRIKQVVRTVANGSVAIPAVVLGRTLINSTGSNSGRAYQAFLRQTSGVSNVVENNTTTTTTLGQQHDGAHNMFANCVEWRDS